MRYEVATILVRVWAASTSSSIHSDKGWVGVNEQGGCCLASAVICDISALTVLVSGAACPACPTCTLAVREPVEKRKGLSAFLELHCANSECPESVLSSVHTSSRVVPGDLVNGASGSREYRNGSSRDSFAVKVKAVVAARDWHQTRTAVAFLCHSWLTDGVTS